MSHATLNAACKHANDVWHDTRDPLTKREIGISMLLQHFGHICEFWVWLVPREAVLLELLLQARHLARAACKRLDDTTGALDDLDVSVRRKQHDLSEFGAHAHQAG